MILWIFLRDYHFNSGVSEIRRKNTVILNMRLISNIKDHPKFKRAMLYQDSEGCYLFLYDKAEDGPCSEDYLFENVKEAQDRCNTEYKINDFEWLEISDPLEGCQDDWISPVRVKGRDTDSPQWGEFQKFENNKWIDIKG